MQSWIEVGEKDLYTLKINFRWKRPVQKPNKGNKWFLKNIYA